MRPQRSAAEQSSVEGRTGRSAAPQRDETAQGRRKTVCVAACALVLAAAALLWIRFNLGFAVDDSYITFTYAKNLADGHGLVFNLGERYWGSTASGYAIILALLEILSGVTGSRQAIPDISTVLSAVGLTLFASALTVRIMRSIGRERPAIGAVVAATVTVFIFLIPGASSVSGHETYFFVGLLAVGVSLAFEFDRPLGAMVSLAVATAVRPDAVLMALIVLGGLAISRVLSARKLRPLVPAAVTYGVLVGAGLVGARLYYGTFLPGTMDAKRAQVLLGHWPIFGVDTVGQALRDFFGGTTPLLAVAMAAALAAGALVFTFRPVRREHNAHLIREVNAMGAAVCWWLFGILTVVSYAAFGVTIWPWYSVPVGFALIASVVTAAAGAFENGMHHRRHAGPKLAVITSIAPIMTVIVAVSGGYVSRADMMLTTNNVNYHLTAYDSVRAYLEAQEPQGTSIAIAEPGKFAYDLGTRYYIVDTLGLATPGVAKALLHRDTGYAIRHYRPTYVITSWSGSYNPTEQPDFHLEYRRVGVFPSAYFTAEGAELVLYVRR